MRLITDIDLTSRTDAELAVLFHMAAQALAASDPGTPGRRAVIASLQNISKARSIRHRQHAVPGL
jgi:hypothetical protein